MTDHEEGLTRGGRPATDAGDATEIDPDVIREREGVGTGGEGGMGPETTDARIGWRGGHIAGPSGPIATSGGFGGREGPSETDREDNTAP